MVFEEEITPSARGGRKGSDSADLDDMEYAESFITGYVPGEGQRDPETLRSLIKREILEKSNSKYKYTMTNLEEMKNFGFDGESMSSCARMIDAVYVALEIPYFAAAYTSSNVVAEKHEQKATTKRKDGTTVEAGTFVTKKIADRVKIHKYGSEWDPAKYSCEEGKNPSSKYVSVDGKKTLKAEADKKGVWHEPWILVHDEPTVGVRRRMAGWLKEATKNYPEILQALNIDGDHIKRLEEKADIKFEEVESGEKEESGNNGEEREEVSEEQITQLPSATPAPV